MIIVTGSNGFIGSNLISSLNQIDEKEIIAVDDLSNKKNLRNISHCDITDLLDIKEFEKAIKNNTLPVRKLSTIFHQGACSDTMEWDAEYILNNNYNFSKLILSYALSKQSSLIYASSAALYGKGKNFTENRKNEEPINLYAYSKYLFDQYVRKKLKESSSQIVGLRYFNVYGPNEARMASVAYHLNQQLKEGDTVKLFEGWDGYKAGQQKRDFVYVDDIIKVNLWFKKNKNISGIFNVGTGKSQTFNEVAEAVIDWNKKGTIKFITFPEQLKDSYQSFTEADIKKLREVGYQEKFLDVKEGIKLYLDKLNNWPKNEF